MLFFCQVLIDFVSILDCQVQFCYLCFDLGVLLCEMLAVQC